MRRRDFLRWTAGAAASLTAPLGVADPDTRPVNLLIIQTDEHNFRTLGCYRRLLPPEQALMWGPAVVETPNIDWLAEQGAICTRFYATTPVCSPSRAAFMSGRYPHNTPVNTNNIPMDAEVVTFAEVLRRNGYATGYAGKWHLDGTDKPQWAPQRKFGFEDNRYMFNRGHWKQLEDTPTGPRVKARKNGRPTYDVQDADARSFTTDFLCDRAVEFLQTHKEVPFCYMVSLPDPHGPDTVRAPYDRMFKGQKYEVPRTFNKPREGLPSWGAPQGRFQDMARYYGMVKCIDDNVGKLLTCLRENSLIERTIVVFTSDHGDLRGEHHRQNKGVPYEGSARIPFVIRSPGTLRPGTVVHEAMTCVDFKPTILKLMGIASPDRDAGRDCSRLLITGQAPPGWNDVAFMRGTGTERGWVAAVTRRYKLVYSTRDDPWLFDLEKDPDELINCFSKPEYRATVQTLSRQLRDYGRTFRDPRVAHPRIQVDLQRAMDGPGPEESPPGP
ncbi:MAG: sulfatase [Phycisphaerales bacterium]|nr:MAG: sulfatase [Phycisphaerales bacterium]